MDRLDFGGDGEAGGVPAHADSADYFPLSPAQLGIWYAQHADPQVPITVAEYVELHGVLDLDVLGQALVAASSELESGFLRIVERDGQPYQYVDHTIADDYRVDYVDLRGEADPAAAAMAWMRAECGRPLELTADQLVRIAGLQLADEHWYWYLRAHHIALDGFAAVTSVARIAEIYTALVNGETIAPAKATDLRTLYDQEMDYRASTRFASDKAYWADRVAGFATGTSLAGRSAPPAARNGVTGALLSDEQSALLEAAVARHDSSPAGVLLAAFAAYLAQWTGAQDVVMSLPVTARTTAVMRRSGGTTSNIVPLRVRVDHATTIADLLAQVRVGVSGALRHQRYRHEDIRRDAAGNDVVAPGGWQAAPVVNIVLFHPRIVLGATVGTLRVLSMGRIEDLGVNFYQSEAGVSPRIDFETNPNLYSEEEARQHHSRFLEFFAGFLAAAADTAVWSLDLTSADERARSAVEWNDSEQEVPDTTLAALLDAQMSLTPENIALDFEGAELTYAELGARVNRLARFLIADGVGPESLVALGMRRSLELVIGMHAVLKAGGAYVPVDPDHPAERTAYILESASPVCVLTAGDELELPKSVRQIRIDTLDVSGYSEAPVTDADRLALLRPENTAYVIYTSGSTGRPKGVAVTHHAIVNQLLWMLDEYRLTADDVYLQKTATTFDVSLWGYFLPLMVGAKLVVAAPEGHRDPRHVADMIARHGVTVTDFVPSLLAEFVSYTTAAQCVTLRTVLVIGEALPPETAAGFRAISSAGLHNLYGPTEAAVSVTYWEATAADTVTVPIGIPAWNVAVYVLDSRLRPAAIGAPGELYLAGCQLARGYLGRPDLTADRFVANPLSDTGERMYRTGDLVRWNDAGTLEYLGRTDFQVKFRGQRIELGEIETTLLAHPAVGQAVVLVADTPTGPQVVAYVVAAPDHSVDPVALTRFAAAKLPGYMVPASTVVLDSFPLNTSGKLDRRALPQLLFRADATGFLAPRTQAEHVVAGIFADVLSQDRIGVDDNFFDLGGNSLVATQVVARIGAAFGTTVGVRALFETPTVAGLAAQADNAGPSYGARPPLVAKQLPERVPLSLAQRRIWFLNQFDPTVPAYNLPFVLRLRDQVDVVALEAALSDVVTRQQSLRTIFPESEDGAYQQVLPADQVDLGIEIRPIEEARLSGALHEFAATGFDVSRELPIRVRIYAVTGGNDDGAEYVVAFVVHHIAADGFSFGPLARDMAAAYLSRVAGRAPDWAPLPVQYQDFSIWQREVLGAESDPGSLAAREIAYWRRALAGLPDRLDLPADRPRTPVQSLRGGRVGLAIDAELHQRLSALARANSVSLFMVMHASLAVLLARLSGTSDIAIGTPVAGRGEPALDDLIGMFVNTLVLRSEIDGAESFTEFLTRTRETDLAAFAFADVPFERLVEVLNPARSQARHPLFQVLLSFQELSHATVELPGLSVSANEIDLDIASFDLQWTITEERGADGAAAGMTVTVSYATDLFDAATVAAFGRRYLRVLDTVAATPDAAVREIELLDAEERATVLTGWNQTAHDLPAATILDLFAGQVPARPDDLAVLFDDGVRSDVAYTYAEFSARVNRLARKLIAEGVGPETLVAVGIGRSMDMLIALYATLTAGGGYVPIDPEHPAARTEYVLATSAPVCVLTTLSDNVSSPDCPVLAVDDLDLSEFSDARVTDADRRAPLRASNTAYVLYTSGSTGAPKGVAVQHSSMLNQIAWLTAEYRIGPADVILQKTPVTFDVSVWELFGPLAAGARLLIAAPEGQHDPRYLSELIERHQVTMTSFVPSMLPVFAGAASTTECASLRVVLVSGEALPPATVAAFRRFSTAAVHNLYGPTECTVHATAWHLDEVAPVSVPIGRPVWNTQAYVLDEGLDPVPVGVPGELYLGGGQTARGYHGRPGLSAERFVADPFGAPGARLYRTGDLVRWVAPRDPELGSAGVLEFLGRNDFQVKFHGQRIELGEIEAALLDHPAVTQAVVRTFDTVLGDRLVAYVVSAAGPVDIDNIADSLRRRLPAYMVPSAIVVLEALPRSLSGKLDRKALPAPMFEATEFRAPTTSIEEIVAGIFGDVLGIARVGVDDDFFELGGNSLIATQVVARLGIALDTRVPVRMLFEAPSVAALAATVAAQVGDGARKALVAKVRPEQVPLSPAQQRMWFRNRFDTESAVNNIPLVIRLSGDLDVAALQVAVIDVIDRHESLRTVFPETKTGPVQVVREAAQIVPDLTPIPVAEHLLFEHLVELASAAFDVATEVPLRAKLFEISASEYVLGVVVHHISADDWSMRPLARDIMEAYVARTSWQAPAWPALPVQYADYVLWQREILGAEGDPSSLIATQIRYWARELAGLPAELVLPSDRPRPAVASYRGGTYPFVISGEMRRALVELGHRGSASLFMVMHSALAVLLARLSGTGDIAIGTPVAGRGEAALDELIGMFVNTLVLRTDVDGAASFADLLEQARETDLHAFAHAEVPFERLVEVLHPARAQARHPLFQVLLTFQNTRQATVELPGLSVRGVDYDTRLAKVDLQLTLHETKDEHGETAGMSAEFCYAEDLFDEATVAAFARRLDRVLAAVTADPAVPVGDIDLLSPEERTQVLVEWNDTARQVPAETLVSLFDAQAAATPDAVALVFDEERLTYRELQVRANRIARQLIGAGVGPESLVALSIRGSNELVIAMYAVLQTGAAYVPLDPDQPADRIDHIIDTARPRMILYRSADGFGIDLQREVPVIAIEGIEGVPGIATSSGEPLTDAERTRPLRPGHTACVLFSAGSIGRPEGVVVSHRAIVNQLRWLQQEYPIGGGDAVLRQTPVARAASVWEFFWPLQTGARLVVAKPDGHRDPGYLAQLIAEHGITTTHFVPSMLTAFVATLGNENRDLLSWLRQIFVSGAALPATTAVTLRELTDARLHCLYGPTEVGAVTYHEATGANTGSAPIGRPVWNTQVYVLDARLHAVAPGVAGELYFAGDQLAIGYLGRTGRTADRFVANPFGAAGVRMYRTGDLVRWAADGVLEYLGRGKRERRTAPPPVYAAKRFRAPTTPIEEIIAQAFGELLGCERVGVDDDFFELGGNPLVATQLVARLSVALDAEIRVRALFEAPTVAALAARLPSWVATGARQALTAQVRPEYPPLSLEQQRVWFLNHFDAGSAADTSTVALRLTGALDLDALRGAIADVVGRHESLRTVYPLRDGVAYQRVLPAIKAIPDLAVDQVAEGGVLGAMAEFVERGIDVAAEPPLRLRTYQLGDQDYVLVLVVHHIAADDFSMRPLVGDLMTAYLARSSASEPDWAPPAVHYVDFALWQRETLGPQDDPNSLMSHQLGYWRAALDGLPDELRLSARPRPAVASYAAGIHRFRVPGALIDELNRLAHVQDATLFMVVHSAFAALLARLSGAGDIAVGTPVAGRAEQALDGMVGTFVNTLVLRAQVDVDQSFTDLLAQVRTNDLQAFAHADLPFARLVEALDPVRTQARHPLFQVLLAFRNQSSVAIELPGLTVHELDIDQQTTKVDLQLLLSAGSDNAMDVELRYATDLFDAAFAATLADRMIRVLREVAADAEIMVGDIELLGDAERTLVLEQWNDTEFPIDAALTSQSGDAAATLVSLFEAQAARTPDAAAVTYDNVTLSYGELAARVHRLARWLKEAGVGPESYVALGIRRSLDLVVGMYAINAAGGAYVPMDPDDPAERIEHILDTTRPVCVLTSGADLDSTVARQVRIDELDLSGFSDEPLTDADRHKPLRPANTAYVIVTSDPTGPPKGVAVSHASIVNCLVWTHAEYGLAADDALLQQTPATVDASVWEFFLPLQVGARLVLATPHGHRDPAYLLRVIAEESITTVQFAPSLLARCVAEDAIGQAITLRNVFSGGAGLPAAAAHRLRAMTGARLHNLYGPAEAAVDATHHEVTDADTGTVPIGAPVFNTQVYVLDSRLRPVPVGVAGELYLAGAQLAHGYVGRPDLTTERFVANPFGAGARMYRTGDLVRWIPPSRSGDGWAADGELEYLGRNDFPRQLDGQRIEPGEIEAKVFRAPVTPTQEIVADTFAEALGVEQIGLDDDFFTLGGNSLIAVRVAARLGAALNTQVPVRVLFEAPTVVGVAARMAAPVGQDTAPEIDAESVAAGQLEYWTAQLCDLPDQIELPADRPRPEVVGNATGTHDFSIDADLRAALAGRAREHGVTLFVVVHAALAVWAGRLSNSTDIAIGARVSRRREHGFDDMVSNTVVLRSEVDPAVRFGELLEQVRRTDLAAFANAELPFEQLVDVISPVRSRAHHPLFQVALTFDAAMATELELAELPGVAAGIGEFETGTAQFDVQLTVGAAADGGLDMSWNYATELFDPATVAVFADRLVRVLHAVAADPRIAVGDIDLLDAAERSAVTQQWVSSGTDSSAGRFGDPMTTLDALFDAAVAEHPHRTAARFGVETLTYAELDRRANVLARRLIADGAGPETLVAVILPRSLDLVVALVAVTKSGAGYVPVDPTYPVDRITAVLADAQPTSVILDSTVQVRVPVALPSVVLDGFAVETGNIEDADDAPIADADRNAALSPDHVAYLMYTSGSSGRPKGVAVTHRNVVRLFANTDRDFGFGPDDVWTLFHSYAFDFSVWELWGPLLFGGTLVVVDYYTSRSPEQFLELLRAEQVTVLNQTPSAFYQLAEADRNAAPDVSPLALRYVVFGGEALELRRLADWVSRRGADAPLLVNMYGITETTVHVSYRALDGATIAATTGSVVGRAVTGLRVYVLDHRLQPVPVGVAGEIYVAGTQLARGYLGRPGLSATRFVADPLGGGDAGARLYRSGDLARWNRFGELEYLGRADDQVKVRGFRIELGEIESAILAQPGIAQAAVIVREDEPGDQRIVAYVVAEPDTVLALDQIRDGAAELLPGHMVPSALVRLEWIPLTVSGKLDRRALPAPAERAPASAA
ncbi:non-ribosomal peptide synthetase, partial [Nocardia altamirensis]|uniref:non-ribosomal peptide synthetase n=1 Tax=Nocardia altamirensis TaxID=472158 RepID=UPI0008400247